MDEILRIFTLTQRDAFMILASSGLFFLFWRVFHVFVLASFFRLIESREEETVVGLERAEAEIKESALLESQYEKKMEEARIVAMKQRLEIIAEAKKTASSIVERGEKGAEQVRASGKAELENVLKGLRSKFSEEVDRLSKEVVERISA